MPVKKSLIPTPQQEGKAERREGCVYECALTMESDLARFRSSSSSWVWERLVVRITASPSAHAPMRERLVKARKKPLECLLFMTTHRHVPLFSQSHDIAPNARKI
jgi:hypothetical protein